jgi:hypothetical protein
MQQPDELVFEALPQRIDANKNKRRRKDTPAAAVEAAAAAAADVAGSSPEAAADSSTAAAADSSTAAATAGTAEAVTAAAAGGSLNAGFGFHNMQQQQQPGSHNQQEPGHIEDPQQYRSAAVGQHKFECKSRKPWELGTVQCVSHGADRVTQRQ